MDSAQFGGSELSTQIASFTGYVDYSPTIDTDITAPTEIPATIDTNLNGSIPQVPGQIDAPDIQESKPKTITKTIDLKDLSKYRDYVVNDPLQSQYKGKVLKRIGNKLVYVPAENTIQNVQSSITK